MVFYRAKSFALLPGKFKSIKIFLVSTDDFL
jgi:hypothetical protein